MAWCPNCHTEYLDTMTTCTECEAPLVDEAAYEAEKDLKLLVYIPENEKEQLLEYLKYSNIEPVVEKMEVRGLGIYVHKQQLSEAVKYLRFYESESEEKEERELCLSEYETLDLDAGGKLKDLLASVYSFLLIGIGLVVISGLHLVEVLDFLAMTSYVYGFMIIGIIFLVISGVTYKKIPELRTTMLHNQEAVDAMVTWFEEKDLVAQMIEQVNFDHENEDTGTYYYVMMDAVKVCMQQAFESETDLLINTACEAVYVKHFAELEHHHVSLSKHHDTQQSE